MRNYEAEDIIWYYMINITDDTWWYYIVHHCIVIHLGFWQNFINHLAASGEHLMLKPGDDEPKIFAKRVVKSVDTYEIHIKVSSQD